MSVAIRWLALALAMSPLVADCQFQLPELPDAHRYGDVVISRGSEGGGVAPVVFSHWSHRMDFTCRVCHFELEFEFKTNATEITEEDNKTGRFCGACHDGKTAFSHGEENCKRCHSGQPANEKKAFKKRVKGLAKSDFGNRVDWSRAVTEGQISPKYSIFYEDEKPYAFDKPLVLEAEWNFIPPAEFPHFEHAAWLDCANCHPDVFNVRKKTTEHFEMRYILEGKFCGVCHMSVAFPIDDCRRCHPKRKSR